MGRFQHEVVALVAGLRLCGGLHVQLCGGGDFARLLVEIGGRGGVARVHRVEVSQRGQPRLRSVRLTDATVRLSRTTGLVGRSLLGRNRHDVLDIADELSRAHHGEMATTRITTVLSALILGTTLTTGGGLLAPPVLADPVDTTTAPTPDAFTYQPLWPFASQDEADHWLRDGAVTGGAPWHADPDTTALLFAKDYLGFAEIDRTTTVTEHVDEAWVGVGYASPSGESTTAATIHLARYGNAPNAPWEVVGSLDDALTLSTPLYGSTTGTVIKAGGTITGVDESLHLQIRQSTQENVLGDYCCVPAGGESRPWSATFSTSPPQPGALTLVVWTGGHVTKVEKFAVTGLRAQ